MIGHIYTLLFLAVQDPPAVKVGGGAAKPRRTVQASDGWTPDNSMQLARARRRRRQQQFVAIHTLQH